MAHLQPIGRITQLQIQTSSLKVEGEPRRYYTPEPIRGVEALTISEGRITGLVDGRETVDVHSAAHPESRNRGNGNMLSVVFTGHYEILRERYGEHMLQGIAGENILVEYDRRLELSDVENGLVIKGQDGRRIAFDTVSVAHPCVEFSRFALDDLNAPAKQVSETLKFLDNGTRGFYAVVTSSLPARIEAGDTLLARD
ncbi:hypothetical protein BH24CHL1_BH24CHL1_17130 [soil metagenome]